MRICIPTEDSNGMDSRVYGHFGSAPYFVVYNVEENGFEVIDNRDKDHVHGQCNPLLSFKEKPFDIMVTGGIGMRALKRLQEAEVKVFKITVENTVEDIIDSFKKGTLNEMTFRESCDHTQKGCH